MPNVECIAPARGARLFQVWKDFHQQAKNKRTLVQDHEQSSWEPQICECFAERGKGFCSKNAIIVHKRFCESFKYVNCKFTITFKKDLNSHIKAKHPPTKLFSKYHSISHAFNFKKIFSGAWLFWVWPSFREQAKNIGTLYYHALWFKPCLWSIVELWGAIQLKGFKFGKGFGSKQTLRVHNRLCGYF